MPALKLLDSTLNAYPQKQRKFQVFWGLPIASIAVSFCGSYLGSYKVIQTGTTMEPMGKGQVPGPQQQRVVV